MRANPAQGHAATGRDTTNLTVDSVQQWAWGWCPAVPSGEGVATRAAGDPANQCAGSGLGSTSLAIRCRRRCRRPEG